MMKNQGQKILFRALASFLVATCCNVQGAQQHVGAPVVKMHVNKLPVNKGTIEHISFKSKKHADSNEYIQRKGELALYPNAHATVLLCHGFMTDKHDVAFLRKLFPAGKYNVMTFDFRAHGEESAGQTCTFGRDEALDVRAAVAFLKSHPKTATKPVLAYGFSMGAAALIEAQSQDASLFNAMVLDCPFDSTEKLIHQCIDALKVSLFGYQFAFPGRNILKKYAMHPYVQSFVKNALKVVIHLDTKNITTHACPVTPVQSIKQVSVPCFFIHCKNDEKVTVNAVKEIYQGAAGYKKMWLTNGRRHYDSYFYSPERYIKEVRGFMRDALRGTLKKGRQQEFIEDHDEPFMLKG